MRVNTAEIDLQTLILTVIILRAKTHNQKGFQHPVITILCGISNYLGQDYLHAVTRNIASKVCKTVH